MISFDQAFAIVLDHARPLGREAVAVASANRRTLAEPVIAHVNHPPAHVSAMDGYAIRDDDLADGASFRVIGTSFPGAPFAGPAEAGTCIRIFTGAPLPPGFDRVVIQENVRRDGDVITLEEAPGSARHVRPLGSDFRAGDVLVEAGSLLGWSTLVVVAGSDMDHVIAWRRPRVAILGTGDELVDPGLSRSTPNSIPESLSPGITALAEDWGGEIVRRYRIGDDPEAIAVAAAEAVSGADLVVVTGGASVGERDFAKASFATLGLEILFSKAAIKPGKPVWFGRVGQALVMGLPGNPTSAMVTARLLLAPLIAGLAGRDPLEAARWTRRPLNADLGATGDRETFHRGRWSDASVEVMRDQNSGAQKALSDAQLLIRRAAGLPAAAAGEMVEVLEF